MDIILIENVDKLGKVGDRVTVKDGYGRNHLLPQKKALRATNDNIAYFETQKAEIEAHNKVLVSDATVKADKISGSHIVLIRQASEDGRLYGSVSSKDIAESVSSKTNIEVLRRQVDLNEPIKNIGIYGVRIVLHGGVSTDIEINVARSETEANEARQTAKHGGDKKAEEIAPEDATPEATEEIGASADNTDEEAA